MSRVLRSELMKLPWLLVLGIALLGPAFAVVLGVSPGTPPPGVSEWTMAFGFAVMRYAWLFYPLLAGVFAALVCRIDHASGGWKLVLAMPVRRSSIYLVKFAILAAVLALCNAAFGIAFVVAGKAEGLHGPIPLLTIGMSLLSGWVAVLPLAAVQLWVSSRWRSFGAALALNVCFTLPAIFAAQSREIGPWYPWAQPMLAMSPMVMRETGQTMLNVAPATLWIVIVGGLAVALAGGITTFARANISA